MREPAVLLLVFNRPEATQRVMDALRRARPARLYVAADGPRPGRTGEQERCAAARATATTVDWPCEVRTLFRDVNLGCRNAVTGALDWFFDHEPEGIILEDDCVPDETFFPYCTELLDRYRDIDRVMVISGNDYHPPTHPRTSSYSFTRYAFIWGWATWRRAWRNNLPTMAGWPELRGTAWLADIGDGSGDFTSYWRERFDEAYSGQVDSWAYTWIYSCWRAEGLGIMPTAHLVANIGFGDDATHTAEANWRGTIPTQSIGFPLRHPPAIERDRDVDLWADMYVYSLVNPRTRPLRAVLNGVPGVLPVARWLRGAVRRLARRTT